MGLAASRRAPSDMLRGGSGRSAVRRTQRLLLFAETGLAVLLLAGAVLLSRSFVQALGVDPGYRVGGLVYADLDPGPERYTDGSRSAPGRAPRSVASSGVSPCRPFSAPPSAPWSRGGYPAECSTGTEGGDPRRATGADEPAAFM